MSEFGDDKEAIIMAKLIIYEEIEGEEPVFETFDLATSHVLIGSAPENHLILEAPEIDPAHASLELRNDAWILQDLGGPGGTGVNGHLIEGPYRLQHRDLIELGQVKMEFQEFDGGTAPEETTTSAPAKRPGETHISGRVWFATVAGGTVALIFIILFLLIVADYLDVIKIIDLLPPWLWG
jgi:hypothetical protein